MNAGRTIGTFLAIFLISALPSASARAGVDVDFGANVAIGDDADLFFRISSRNYDRDEGEVRTWARSFPNPDDLAVALHLASYCDRGPEFFFSLRRQGVGWFEISRRCQVPVNVWFVPVQRDPGPPYGRAYGYWRKHGHDRDARFVLTDREARDLVAVRLIHDYYGVPVETAMSWRKDGRDVRGLMVKEYGRRHARGSSEKGRSARGPEGSRGDKRIGKTAGGSSKGSEAHGAGGGGGGPAHGKPHGNGKSKGNSSARGRL